MNMNAILIGLILDLIIERSKWKTVQ